MRRKKYTPRYLSDEFVSITGLVEENTNAERIKQMKKTMFKAIKYELTPRQRYCLCEHYLKGRSMKAIAFELDIHPSTVTRHIQNAVSRLQRVGRYY